MDRQDGAKAVPVGRHTLEAAVGIERLADALRALGDLVGGISSPRIVSWVMSWRRWTSE